MTNSDNKLILVKDNEGKAQIRYRKTNEPHWSTIYSNETDIDEVIEQIIFNFAKKK